MTDIGIFICPVCEAVIEGDRPCPNRNLRPHQPLPPPTEATVELDEHYLDALPPIEEDQP